MKLRLPNKLIAAIMAAASPVLFQTLSTATLGVAAVAAVAGQQAMGEWADGDYLLNTDEKPAEGDWNVDLTGHETVNLMEKGGVDASRQAQLGTVTLDADAALAIASNIGHGEQSEQNFTNLRIATLSFGGADNSGSLTVNSWNTATVAAVTGALTAVNVQANGKLTLGAAETTVSRVNGGLVNGELHLNMSTDAEGSGDGVIKLDEASAGHVYVDSGVFATNKQYGVLETNLRDAKLHLAGGTTFLVRNSVGTGDITPVKDAYLKGSLTFRVYGSVGAATQLTTNFHKDAGAGETVITRTDGGNITLTGTIDLDKFNANAGTTNFAGTTTTFGTQVSLNNATINVTGGTFTTDILYFGNSNGNFSVSAGAVANVTNFQNSWGFNTATINGVLNTQNLWMTSGGANNNLTGTGIINADKVNLTNNGNYHFTGIRLNVGAQGIINNRPTTMTSVTLGAMTDWTMTSSGVTYGGDMVIDTRHWNKETNTADSASTHTITFNEAFNEMSGTPLTSLAIEGTGTVVMKKAANIAHAHVTLSGGTLELQKGGAFGSIRGTSGNLILAGNNTLQVGGPISLGSGSLTMGAGVQIYMTPAAFADTAIGAVGFSEDDGEGHRDGYAIGQFQLATAGSIDLQGQPGAGTLEVRDLAAGGKGLVLTLDGTEGGNYMVNWNVDYSATATGNHNAYGATNIYLTTSLNETTGQHSTLNVKSALNGVQSIVSNGGVINLGEGITWTVSDLNKVSAVGNGQTLITGDGALKVTSTNDVHSMTDLLRNPLLTTNGAVQISGSFNEQNANYTFDKMLEGTQGHLEFVGFTGYDNNWFNGSGHGDFASDVVLTDNGSTPAWKINAATSGTGNYFNATGKWSGTGTFQTACNKLNFRFNNDISEWEGTFDFSSGDGSLVLAGDANEVNAEIKKSGGTLTVVADTDVIFKNKVQANSLTVNAGKHATLDNEMNVATMTVNANGALTLGDGFSMKDGVTAAVSGAGSVDVHKLESDTETLSIHDGKDGYVTATLDLSRYQNKLTFGQTGWMVDGVTVGTTADGGGVTFNSDNYTLTVSGGKYFQVNTTVTMDEVAAPAGGGRAVLVGDGTYVLGSNFVTDNAAWSGNGQISTDPTQWTGTVQLTGTMKSSNPTPYDLNDYANSASWVELRGFVGYDKNWAGTLSANIKLTDIVNEDGDVTQVAWYYEDAVSSTNVNYMTASGAWEGSGTFAFHNKYQGIKFTGDISGWEGAITSTVGGTKSVWFAANNAMEVNAAISRTAGTMDLRASTGVAFNKAVTADKLTVEGNGKVSFNETTSLSEIVVNSNITATIAGTGAISLSTSAKDHGLQVNSGATVNIETRDLTIANGALFDMGGRLNIGNGTDATLVKSKWLVTGNVNNWGTSALNINKNATVAVSGNDTSDSHQTGIMFSEWNNTSTVTIEGNLLAQNASVKGHTNCPYHLIVENGGVLAVKGISADNSGSTFTLKDGGTLILGGATSNNTGSTTLQAGSSIGISADSVTFARAAALSAADGKSVIIDTEKYAFNAAGTAIAKPVGEQIGGTLNLSGVLSGNGSLEKIGAGTLELSGANTFTGDLTVSGGTLKMRNGSALGANNGGTGAKTKRTITIGAGATIDIYGNDNTAYEYTLAGGSLENNGDGTNTNHIQNSKLTLTANSYVGGTGNLYVITNGWGATSIELKGNTLTKTGTNTFGLYSTTVTGGANGALRVEGGAINGANASNVVDANLIVAQGTSAAFTGTFKLNGGHSISSVVSGGSVSAAMTLQEGVTKLTAAGADTLTMSGVLSGSGSVAKTDTGAVTLSAVNTYTGGTSIENGALILTNSNGLSSSVVTFADCSTEEAAHRVLAFETGATYDSQTGTLTGGTRIDGTVAGLSGYRGTVVADTLTINVASGEKQFFHRYDNDHMADGQTTDAAVLDVNRLVKQGAGTQVIGGEYTTARGFSAAGLVISDGVDVQGGTLHLKTRGVVTANFDVQAGATLKTTDDNTNHTTPDDSVKYDGKVTLHGTTSENAATLNYADGSTNITNGLYVDGFGKVVNQYDKNQFIGGLYNAEGTTGNDISFNRPDSPWDNTDSLLSAAVITASGDFTGTVHVSNGMEKNDGTRLHEEYGLQVLGTGAKNALAGAVVDFTGDNVSVLSFRNSDTASTDWTNSKMDGSVAGLTGANGAVYAAGLTINTNNALADYTYSGKLDVNTLTKQGGGNQTLTFALTEPKTINRTYAQGGTLIIENTGSSVLTLRGVDQEDGELVLSHGAFAIGADDVGSNNHGLFALVDSGSATGGVQLKHGATLNLTAVNHNWRFQLNAGTLSEEDGLVHGGGITIEGAKTVGDDTYAASVFNVALNDGNSMSVRALNDSGEAAIRATSSLNYSVGSTSVQISNAEVTLGGASSSTIVNNQLVNVSFTNTGATDIALTNTNNTLTAVHAEKGAITVQNADSSAATLKSIKATGANVTMDGLKQAASVSLNELVIGEGKTVSATNTVADARARSADPTDDQVFANIEVSGTQSAPGTLTVGMGGTAVNINLTVSGYVNANLPTSGLNLNNGSLTLSAQGGNIFITDDMMATLHNSGQLMLFSGVKDLTLFDAEGSKVDMSQTTYYGEVVTYAPANTFFAGVDGAQYAVVFNANTGEVYLAPEPATTALSLLALSALAARRRRK